MVASVFFLSLFHPLFVDLFFSRNIRLVERLPSLRLPPQKTEIIVFEWEDRGFVLPVRRDSTRYMRTRSSQRNMLLFLLLLLIPTLAHRKDQARGFKRGCPRKIRKSAKRKRKGSKNATDGITRLLKPCGVQSTIRAPLTAQMSTDNTMLTVHQCSTRLNL